MKKWIQAARLRTLPLSVSGIIVGSAYAYFQGFENSLIIVFALLTTLGFQVLSNFANDYGDGVKGTDNENRVGPQRAIQSGAISVDQMKKAIIITAVLSLISAVTLIYISFGKENFGYSLLFFFLGIASIIAAIKYTVGKGAYGYSGFGDVFVFIFFGLVSVLGSNFLFTKQFDWILVLPAVAVGLLSVAVLNLNNMRDIENDRNSGKNTIVVKMGLQTAKYYHYTIVVIAVLATVVFSFLVGINYFAALFIAVLMFRHLKTVQKAKTYTDFDPELKKVALGTFALAILLSLTLVFFY
ncbi:1,4-dihydroxy-2-naphthoate octaprenyltransferase [Flavobacterium enshiense DK69]|uniref:1,4-dihydroxy-2-naphthoate octaprenyltransferase n=1 Tax=Flavobacterium enshiense DK69 TaxID=1107311 RepID=V6S841_9FLAO|nr:1,4-dihydroxy-2-naphthoate octaprenyltransferase [Flavobacterium enshiense]ESU22574.1 1,4-dihydroxy-2-naphthoate octaprenyltransferase [Flavobacterium enshiense DK69]KGO95712.1 1,4-dihydroxy-2-naphthoate prenyltransferase [Flavobacterium enshiense DK69]